MGFGRRLLSILAAIGVVLGAADARAQARVLEPADQPASVVSARVAYSVGAERTTSWLSLELDGPARHIVLVLPADTGTAIDEASDAWLESLELATAPRIVPPANVSLPSCGDGSELRLVDDTNRAEHRETLAPMAISVLSSLGDLASFAASRGVAFTEADRVALSGAKTTSFVALEFALPDGGGLTRSVRIATAAPNALIPLSLFYSTRSAELTLFAIAGARARLSDTTELTSGDLGAVFTLATGKSDYVARRSARLQADAGKSVVVEASGRTPLFSFRLLPNGSLAITPVVSGYFARAAELGELAVDPDDCTALVQQIAARGGVVATVCPAGSLARVGDASCVESTRAGQIDAAPLRCGGADDLAFAFSGLPLESVRVTRFKTVIGEQSPAHPLIASIDGTNEISAVVSASSLDTTACSNLVAGGVSGAGGALGIGGFPGGNGSGGFLGGNGSGGSSAQSSGNGSGTVVVDDGGGSDVHCSGSSNGSCSGDTSSSGDDEGCGSDSGSKSDGGDSCSNDGGDSCSNDSSNGGDDCSSDSGGGDDCSGSDGGSDSCDSGGGGDSCDSGSGGGECSVRRLRARPRVSAITFALTALLLPLRRARRKRRAR